MNLNNLEQKVKNLQDETSSLKGQLSLLNEQSVKTQKNLEDLKEKQIVNKKAVELLNLVQKATKELIQGSFENIVSDALQYIHQDSEYGFELEFGKRGNTPELNFNIKTPDMKESHDIMLTNSGGSCDVVALALRFVLLEVSKTDGFMFLDEPEKHLDNENTISKMIEFVKTIQKESNRQIFWITHKNEVVDAVENPIVFKK